MRYVHLDELLTNPQLKGKGERVSNVTPWFELHLAFKFAACSHNASCLIRKKQLANCEFQNSIPFWADEGKEIIKMK